jgi:glutamate-1-semialdehyde 2,1-aminomutase
MAAGLKTLELINQPGFYKNLSEKTQALVEGIKQAAGKHNIPLTYNHACGMFGLFFTEQESVTNFDQANHCNLGRFKTFFHSMLKQGVYFAPSAFEAGFVSAAHSDLDIQKTIDAADNVFQN